jgi:hypothetical protein
MILVVADTGPLYYLILIEAIKLQEKNEGVQIRAYSIDCQRAAFSLRCRHT